jgi:hypothetical protein
MSPQRVADAANPHPYPFVVRQERLPPDDRERNGKPRKSKPRPRADRNTRQEEEIRFNTGPRNLRGAPVNRGSRRPFRMLGRYDRGYDDHTGTVLHPKSYLSTLSQFLLGIPDYPPPSFQEAITTPPLSACSSTTTLVPVSIPAVLIPEDIPEVPEIVVVPSNVETLNELVVSDQGSDSDESLQIIDKSSVVGSDDLPKGVELEQRIRSDWKFRRGVDFPGSSYSDSSQNLGNEMDTDRGRSTLKIPGRLTIDPDASVVEDQSNMSPISPTKRRFLSLSPLRTILSPRLLTDRPMSAHPSPGSSPYAASSRNVFFRSSMNLATSSMMKLPLSPDKNDKSFTRKLFGKGKEKLDTWEVLKEDNYPDEFEAEGDYPSSLMSAVQSLKLSPSFIMGNSPTRSQSYTVGVRPSTQTNQFPDGSRDGTMDEERPSKARQTASLRDRKGPSGALLDRQIRGSLASSSTSAVSSMADSSPAISPVIHPLVESSRATPAPSISKNTAPPIHPSRLRLTVTTGNQAPSTIYQQALDTPLPATPVYRTQFDMTSVSARSVPDPLNDSISAGEICATVNCQINFTEEPMTPNRHHYTGRPLPRPPPSVTRSNIDSTFAPEVVYDADTEGRSSARCPEGLLIDLNDTSRCPERLLIDLDDTSLDGSGASTPLSDGAHLRSQLHLTITPSSSSAADLTMESGSQRSALSDSTIRGRSSPMSDVNQPFEPTELDLLASRIAYGGNDGSDYEVSAGHPLWTPIFNYSPDTASGLRVNRTGKPNSCPHSAAPASYLAASQRQHFPHWANRS